MKVIFTSILVSLLAMNSFSQEADSRKFHAGLTFGYGVSFQKMGTKYLDKDGLGHDLTVGASFVFNINKTIGFMTGLEFDFARLNYQSSSDGAFYYYNASDNEIISYQNADLVNNNLYQLKERNQRAVYLTLPTMMVFRTKFIGYWRYYGKFGLRTSFLLSNKINDEGNNLDNIVDMNIINSEGNDNFKAKLEMFPIKSSVGFAGGAEWNFSGETILSAEIGYYYGFTPLYVKKSSDKAYLFNRANTEPFSNKATQGQLMMKVSILF